MDEEGQEAAVPEEPTDAGVAAEEEEIQIPVEASDSISSDARRENTR